jgi:DNA-binding beta-propeller fold protein YncE
MYVANTAYHSIVKVPVTLNHDGSVTLAGTTGVLTTGINAPDGIAVDRHDNLWVVANQQDEVDVIDPNAIDRPGNTLPKIIARRGDFDGIDKDGTIRGLLFPASPAFSADGHSSTSPTSRSTCPTPEYRSRRSTRLERSKSSTTRSPRFAPKSLP